MPVKNKKYQCDTCGKIVPLVTKASEPSRLQAFCDCGANGNRCIYEGDDPDYISLQDRLEPGEPAPAQTKSKRR